MLDQKQGVPRAVFPVNISLFLLITFKIIIFMYEIKLLLLSLASFQAKALFLGSNSSWNSIVTT